MKVIKSVENRGILLKETARKITSQEGEFLSFFRPLMTAGLPLMKSVLTTLVTNVLDYHLDYQQQCQQHMQLFFKKVMDQVTKCPLKISKTKIDMSMKLSSQNHISFVCIRVSFVSRGVTMTSFL